MPKGRIERKSNKSILTDTLYYLKRNMNYSFKTTIGKVIKYFVIFLLPFLVDKFIIQYPELAQISIGALLVGIVNYLKVGVGVKLP